ncbi:hypothetical protein TEGAF0_02230 [Sediminibacterium sp. TEGAF015]|nr:hypothetical protein TEGAF0_02230 [Sediminibacterium sp. TEGAF015]
MLFSFVVENLSLNQLFVKQIIVYEEDFSCLAFMHVLDY